MSKKRVLLGMSGGVDSSAAALVLLRAGYEVAGVTMLLHRQEADGGCGSLKEAGDAARVCETLGIPHEIVDFSEEFSARVKADFVSEYQRGRTPNPCIVCNRYLKFGALLDYALGGALILWLPATMPWWKSGETAGLCCVPPRPRTRAMSSTA